MGRLLFGIGDNMLIGYNDDTDILAGIPMSTVYPTVTQLPDQ